MKYLLLILSLNALAAEPEPKKQEPIKVIAPRELASVDPVTGKVTLMKGVKPDEVYNTLLSAIQESNKQLKECQLSKSK